MSTRSQWGCVVAVFVIVAFAALYAVSDAAAILILWLVGVVMLWRAVDKRVSDSSATPPPVKEAPSEDVYAVESVEVRSVERSPEGVMFTIHPKRVEVPRGD